MRTDLILYAPNVHTGGGIALLNELLSVWPTGKPLRAFMDIRSLGRLVLPTPTEVTWVAPCVLARFRAEFQVHQAGNSKNVTIFCFHSLPPLLPLRGKVVIFVQNRLLIEQGSLAVYPLGVRIRLGIERLWSYALQGRCSHYIVQTTLMATLLRQWLQRDVPISVMPFTPAAYSRVVSNPDDTVQKFDFVYVASGEAHKNHGNLLEAWRLLADAGFKPSLALTIAPEAYPLLAKEIFRHTQGYGLNIVNLGQVPTMDMPALYQSSSALIFPSKIESFGLPLIEATQLGLPVLASELDYVRDVIQPVETFDPDSPVSIARAVRRFLKNTEPTIPIRSAEEFLKEVLR